MITQAIRKNSIILTIFAICTAGLLAVTFQGTKERITASERAAAQKALLEVVTKHDNDLLADTKQIPETALAQLGLKGPEVVNIARVDGHIDAVIVPAIAPDGYSGAIRLIVGVDHNMNITGVRVLSHKETPGLGDKVDTKKTNWVHGFNGKSLTNPSVWAVKKDGGEFDQFTGATITPRAVVRQVEKVLQFVDEHKDMLFETQTELTESP